MLGRTRVQVLGRIHLLTAAQHGDIWQTCVETHTHRNGFPDYSGEEEEPRGDPYPPHTSSGSIGVLVWNMGRESLGGHSIGTEDYGAPWNI